MLCCTTLLYHLNFSSNTLFIMLLKLDQMVLRFWILHEQIIDIVYYFLNTGEDIYVASKSNLVENSYFS